MFYYFCVSRGVSPPPPRNSGILGGKFLTRQRVPKLLPSGVVSAIGVGHQGKIYYSSNHDNWPLTGLFFGPWAPHPPEGVAGGGAWPI